MTEREQGYDEKAAETQEAPDEGSGWEGESEQGGTEQSESAEK